MGGCVCVCVCDEGAWEGGGKRKKLTELTQ